MLRPLSVVLVLLGFTGVAGAQSYTVFGDYPQARFGSNVTVTGDIGGNGDCKLGGNVHVSGSIAGDIIDVRGGSVVSVETRVRQSVRTHGTPTPVLGTIVYPPYPFFVVPPPPTVAPPTDGDRVAGPGQTLTIDPGAYALVKASSGSTLILHGGEYDVDELVVNGHGTTLLCDVAPTPSCVVRVKTLLVLAGDQIGGIDGTSGGGALSIAYAGVKTVRLGRASAYIEADVVAPVARVRLPSSKLRATHFTGHLYGAEVFVGAGAFLSVAPTCGDGTVQPPAEDCDPPAAGTCVNGCLPDCTCAP